MFIFNNTQMVASGNSTMTIDYSTYNLNDHFKQYTDKYMEYTKGVEMIFLDNIIRKSTSINAKAYILTVLLDKLDHSTFRKIMEKIDLPEMLKACKILDGNRLKRQILEKIKKYPTSKAYKNELINQEIKMKEYENEYTTKLSLTSSKNKMIRKWTKSLLPTELEYRAIMFPLSMWKELADITHLHSSRDFQLDWFLPYCFGKDLPEDNIVKDYKKMTTDNFYELYDKHNYSYELLRLKLDMKNDNKVMNKIKEYIIGHENITTILWWWDELIGNSKLENIDIVFNKLRDQGNTQISYGTIVDIISKTTNKQILNELLRLGEMRLLEYNIKSTGHIAVLGDQSGSMEVAIRTSGIIISLLCYICKASLHMFASENTTYINPPRTIEEAVEFGKNVRASGGTSPAASLMYLYKSKIVAKTIIIVTDEEENVPCEGYNFAKLYNKYFNEISPANLIFISFSNPNCDAQMVKDLRTVIGNSLVKEFVKVFKFDVKNPDLNRMDIILHYLANN